MIGCHIYHLAQDNQAALDRVEKFDVLNHLANLNSILYWKKHYGELRLYCNEAALAYINKYDLLKYYDKIDTTVVSSTNRMFWSYCKLQLAKHLAHELSEFCIFDNDLWFRQPNMLNTLSDITLYHDEAYDTRRAECHYPDPAKYVGSPWLEQLDWTVPPRNSAIMHFKGNKNSIIDTWYEIATQVIQKFNYDLTPWESQIGTMFIEQRLLSTLAAFYDVRVDTLLPCTYQTDNAVLDGSEWVPRLDHSAASRYVAANIKHVWGLKKYYNNLNLRRIVFDAAMSSALQITDVVKEHPDLVTDALNAIYDEINRG